VCTAGAHKYVMPVAATTRRRLAKHAAVESGGSRSSGCLGGLGGGGRRDREEGVTRDVRCRIIVVTAAAGMGNSHVT